MEYGLCLCNEDVVKLLTDFFAGVSRYVTVKLVSDAG